MEHCVILFIVDFCADGVRLKAKVLASVLFMVVFLNHIF